MGGRVETEMSVRGLCFFWVVTLMVACGGAENVDALQDTAPDVTLDVGVDVGQDTSPDVPTDVVGGDVGDAQDPADAVADAGDVQADTLEDTFVPSSYDCGDEGLYIVHPLGSWRVCLSFDLQENAPDLSAQALALLESDLTKVEGFFEPSVVTRLQEVRFWLELDKPQFPGGVYHPNPVWLAENGYPEYWAEGIQLGNAANYLNWTNIQPAMVLHELAHAWHHQVLGFDQPAIKAAFEAAMASGIYADVAYSGGGTQEAYATTNHIEYFAELTEAYFWVNDFYAFTKDELESFDPLGFLVVQDAWLPVE
jgi:hypothetical protein